MEFFAIFCLIEVSRLPESGTQANRWDEMGRIPPPRTLRRDGACRTLMQLEQGELRSHLIFRCWQRTHARIRACLCGAAGETVGDMTGPDSCHIPDGAK